MIIMSQYGDKPINTSSSVKSLCDLNDYIEKKSKESNIKETEYDLAFNGDQMLVEHGKQIGFKMIQNKIHDIVKEEQ